MLSTAAKPRVHTTQSHVRFAAVDAARKARPKARSNVLSKFSSAMIPMNAVCFVTATSQVQLDDSRGDKHDLPAP